MSEPGLVVSGLNVRYAGADVSAVRDVEFSVPRGELFMLLGPSGCGKSSVLRALAGLEHPEDGRVILGGRILTDTAAGIRVPPQDRGVGMVFQSYALWPHMTVEENVALSTSRAWHGSGRSQ